MTEATTSGPRPGEGAAESTIRPFQVSVPDEELADLRGIMAMRSDPTARLRPSSWSTPPPSRSSVSGAKYDDLERRLAEAPAITVPAITLEGDANGAPHPDPASYAEKFTGKYTHRLIPGGVGHNLPQEAPQAFADAIVEVGGY